MTSFYSTFPKWFTHLSVVGIATVTLAGLTFAEPSSTLIPSHGGSGHTVNYEGHGSPHGSPHHGMRHSGHVSSPHGSGHAGSYGSGASAHGTTHPGPHQSASEFIDHVLKFKDGMGITDNQEAALRTLETNFKKTQIKLKAQSDLANLELHELLRDDKASMSEIETKLRSVHEIKADQYLASIKARRDAKAVLSEEQRSRMDTIHERIKNHGSKMKGYSRGNSPHGSLSNQGG